MSKRPTSAPSGGRGAPERKPPIIFQKPVARFSFERTNAARNSSRSGQRPSSARSAPSASRRRIGVQTRGLPRSGQGAASARGVPYSSRHKIGAQTRGRKLVRPRTSVASSGGRSKLRYASKSQQEQEQREEERRASFSLSVRAALLAHQHHLSFAKSVNVKRSSPLPNESTNKHKRISNKTQYLLQEYMSGMEACPFPTPSPRGQGGEGFAEVRKQVLQSWISTLEEDRRIFPRCQKSVPESVAVEAVDSAEAVHAMIAAHVESSYLLKKMSADAALPNALSSALCIESLKQLAEIEPRYKAILSSSAAILEAGVFDLREQRGTSRARELGGGSRGTSIERERTRAHDARKLVDQEAYFQTCERLARENEELRIKATKYDAIVNEKGVSAVVKLMKALPSAEARNEALVEVLRELKRNDEIGAPQLSSILPPLLEGTSPRSLAELVLALLNSSRSVHDKDSATGTERANQEQRCRNSLHTKTEVLAHMLRSNGDDFAAVFEKHRRLFNELIVPTANQNRSGFLSKVIEKTPQVVADSLWSSPTLSNDILLAKPHILARLMDAPITRTRDFWKSIPTLVPRMLRRALKLDPEILPSIFEEDVNLLRVVFQSHPALFGRLAAISPRLVVEILGAEKRSENVMRFLTSNPSLVVDFLTSDKHLLRAQAIHSSALMDYGINHFPQKAAQAYERKPHLLSAMVEAKPSLLNRVFHDMPSLYYTVMEAGIEDIKRKPALLDHLGLRIAPEAAEVYVQTDPMKVENKNVLVNKNVKPFASLLGKKRKNYSPMPQAEVDFLIAIILERKMRIDEIDHAARNELEPLNDLVLEVLGEHTRFREFVLGVQKYEKVSKRAHIFGLVSGAISVNRFHAQAIDFFLHLLNSIFCKAKGEAKAGSNASGGRARANHGGQWFGNPVAGAVPGLALDGDAEAWKSFDVQDYGIAAMLGATDNTTQVPVTIALELCHHMLGSDSSMEQDAAERIKAGWYEEKAARSSATLARVSQEEGNGEIDATYSISGEDPLGERDCGTRSRGKGLEQGRRPASGDSGAAVGETSPSLPSSPSQPGRGAQEAGVNTTPGSDVHIGLEDLLGIVMSAWFAVQDREREELVQLFHDSDENGDGVLSLDEFSAMVRSADPSNDDRTIMRMFRMCGEENEDGEILMDPLEFVSVMRYWKAKSLLSTI